MTNESSFATGYVQKLITELAKLLGCPIEMVEDRDVRHPSKME